MQKTGNYFKPLITDLESIRLQIEQKLRAIRVSYFKELFTRLFNHIFFPFFRIKIILQRKDFGEKSTCLRKTAHIKYVHRKGLKVMLITKL